MNEVNDEIAELSTQLFFQLNIREVSPELAEKIRIREGIVLAREDKRKDELREKQCKAEHKPRPSS